jgi:serine phosphatase RsbU (regulator of sigma subunit)
MTDKARILIVDDEPFNVDYLEQELEEAEYATARAANGQEALEKVRNEPPDLILLDIMMPVMDGFQVLSRLKADEATRDIPVIVISASNNLESVVRGIQLGAEDYLPKPFEPVLLHARICSSLEKKRLRDLEHLYMKGLEREMQIGREIQQGFLPRSLPKADGWEVAAYFQAAREVAGDFYDAFLLADGSLACVIGDVCGKGVGAALFMTLFRSLIRATFTTDALGGPALLTPAERLQHAISFTNHYVADTHEDADMFATMFLGVFEPQGGKLTYANCGHEPPILRRANGDSITLRPTGPAVGAIPEACFGVKEILMGEGDVLLAFTDGIPDALNAQGQFFEKARLPEWMEAERQPAAILDRIQRELCGFVGETEPFDDITMMAVRRRATEATGE